MAGVEEDEVTSSEPTEELWNIAVTTNDVSSNVPSKSSNEILTELFGAFNAEPPESLIVSQDESGNETAAKKHKKKHKKEKKHKKKSKSKRRLSGEQNDVISSDSENEQEKRKEKKHKSKKKHRRKSSDMDSEDEGKPKKRSRHSKSPPVVIKKEPISDSEKDVTKEIVKEPTVEVKKEKEVNGDAEPETNEVTSTSASCPSPPPLSALKKKDEEEDDKSGFESIKPLEAGDDKTDKTKPVMGKIVIKDLKFSSVYEATVKEVEEQAKAKAEKYEEGELSDSSSQKTSSDLSEDAGTAPSLGSEGGEAAESKTKPNEDPKISKRSHSQDQSSRHHKKSRHRSKSRSRSRSKDKDHHCRHKDKHRDKNKEKDREKEKERDKVKEKERDKDKDKDKDKEREKEREKEKEKEKDKDKEKDRDRHREKERERDRHRERDRTRERSRDKDRNKERNGDRKDRDGERKERDGDRKDKDRRRGHSRSRSPHGSRNRSSSRNRRRHSRDRRHSRSRSRDRKRPDHIDKKKLLEIARRNAMNMLQAGILPPSMLGKAGDPPVASTVTTGKPEKNAAKTVDELTEYCKELSKRENMGELSSLSGSEDSDSEKAFHHPFLVKDRPSFISMNIKNAVPLPCKTSREMTVESSQLRITQFPVSSGQQHRKTESEWIPVTPTPPALPAPPKKDERKSSLRAIEAPKPVEPVPTSASAPSTDMIDIGTLVSERLAAIRKKHDSEHHQYVDHMYGWRNNALPGQYTGDTGVRLLTPQQLASGAQAWARKDQLQTATPVRSGVGMTLLQKMGWNPGEGLGKNKEGCQEPLQLEVKMDRKGLVAAEEIRARRPPPTVNQPRAPKAPNPMTLEGKHPVSLLTEYCSKRHFGAPHFELCMETGPDHKKDFIFKVRVNGMEYTPSAASPNKKQAKLEAATVCLKALGVLIS